MSEGEEGEEGGSGEPWQCHEERMGGKGKGGGGGQVGGTGEGELKHAYVQDHDLVYWARNKCLQNMISTTQAGLGRLV